MRRAIGDTDAIRRQNRGLVLDALRRLGPLPRTGLARETGLSNATITTIVADLTQQQVLAEIYGEPDAQKARGRPAVRVGFTRNRAFALLAEIEVNRTRFSLVDHGGVLVDRLELAMAPDLFDGQSPVAFLSACVQDMRRRNPEETKGLVAFAASVQGILDRPHKGLEWSPVRGLAGHDLAGGVLAETGLPLTLVKRGQLLAEGTRWLFPDMRDANVATVFVGPTVAMGVSFAGASTAGFQEVPTEFGHMIHLPRGALCRCGTRGCIEAYAADYGVLRTAYGVPEHTAPAPSVPPDQYHRLIESARAGERNAQHAFNLAGAAIGYGLNRLMTVFDPSHVMIVGPGAAAYPYMQAELEQALAASLSARVHGTPQILTHGDETEPVFIGLKMKTLADLDQTLFAALPAAANREDT